MSKVLNQIKIPDQISVKEFAEKIGIPVIKIIGELMKNGVVATINKKIDFETASIVSSELGISIEKEQEVSSADELMQGDIDKILDNIEGKKKTRPPVVTVMGHVDHGKTKLLDYMRKANVVATESGGITQHIGAYMVKSKDKDITFIDTPGHEAFTQMRVRGAKMTDIAILVVAADEGVKPQTEEAISHAKEAGVPIIVALNKIDKKESDIDRVKSELANFGLQAEDWGGDCIMVPVSALTGEGIDLLLEMILLVSEMEKLETVFDRPALGNILESNFSTGMGPVATVIIRAGKLRVGDNFVVGSIFGRVKSMKDFKGKAIKEALPSMPVQISGFSGAPEAGDIFEVLVDEKEAKGQAQKVAELKKEKVEAERSKADIFEKIKSGSKKELKIILKADTRGTLEAIRSSVEKKKSQEISSQIIHAGVGELTASDVLMASASEAVILGFRVKADASVQRTAEKEKVEILVFNIIYELLETLEKILLGMLEPEEIEKQLGKLVVKGVFYKKGKEITIGGEITEGFLEPNSEFRVLSKAELLGEGKITSLKIVNEDVKKVEEGNECGLKVHTAVDVKPGDVLEVFRIEKKIRGEL